ncbi:Phophatidylserine decarboxylase-domain-containing protein [Aspergillus avenaceus]|uniref:Phophatidylserine decarboxylase-domain-containing protein n=1 Tax=Aspergillus avenaceus TaxID=36643 RepID=A0A5N6U746_ASPAV|nr:Phophatidylserine decarboxylase-domain-containing protein [Aspergillus avenaceus]
MWMNKVLSLTTIFLGTVAGGYESHDIASALPAFGLPPISNPRLSALQDAQYYKQWFVCITQGVDREPQDVSSVVQEFQEFIESNSRIYMLFNSMFEEIPDDSMASTDMNGYPRVRDYRHMLQVLNKVLSSAPLWRDNAPYPILMPIPINTLLAWVMGTASGSAAFSDPDVNAMLKKVLNTWGCYMRSPASLSALGNGPTGWLSEKAIQNLTKVGNAGITSYTFCQLYDCEPAVPNHGFQSWDDFFTRSFRKGIRPVASPDDDSVIANPTESTPYAMKRGIKARDNFWLKGQNYSVQDMLGHDPLAKEFVGGTIYQALLTALSYHRWHAPVSGRIVKAYTIPGTYSSVPPSTGGHHTGGTHPNDLMEGYAYITAMATRAVILIESDNPDIGLVAFLGIGLAEVSSCEITVKRGDRVQKGDQIGMFHYGGSTSVLILRGGVDALGFPEGGNDNIPVGSRLAVVPSKI